MFDLTASIPMLMKALPWIGGAIGGFFLSVLGRRRPLISYNVAHNQIGMSADDAVLGTVEVHYAGRVVHNLFSSTVTIQNRSIFDLENVDLKPFRAHDQMLLLTERSHLSDTIETLDLTDEFTQRITEDAKFRAEVHAAGTQEEPGNKQRIKRDLDYVHGQRNYVLPVMNRGQIVTITYLVETAAGVQPAILLSCNTKGVRVREKKYPLIRTHLFGVLLVEAAWLGVAIGFAAIGIAIWLFGLPWHQLVLPYLLGIMVSLVGATAIAAYRRLRTLIVA